MLLAHSGFGRSRESVNDHFGGVGKVKLVNISTREQCADLLLLLSSSDSRRFPTSIYGIQNDIVEPNRSVDVAVLACFFIFLLPSDFLLIGTYTPQNIGKRSAVSALLRPLSLSLSLSPNFF